MNGREKKAKAAKDPIQNPQYIYQYKIQNIVPNTFSNTESIAQEESLHNQLKKINHYPSTVEGGGEGLLISSPHYYGVFVFTVFTWSFEYVQHESTWRLFTSLDE